MLRQFSFAERHIEVEIAELAGSTRLDLKNVIAREGGPLTGSAELLILRRGVKSLTINGARHALRRSGSEIDVDSLPDFYDPESYEDLIERLTREIVTVNPWLAYRAPFSDVFASYTPGEEEIKDPTSLPGTSTAGPTSTSDTPNRAAY